MSFHRECRDCGKMFLPDSKGSVLCLKCWVKVRSKKGKKYNQNNTTYRIMSLIKKIKENEKDIKIKW